jgi:hypothetical protein
MNAEEMFKRQKEDGVYPTVDEIRAMGKDEFVKYFMLGMKTLSEKDRDAWLKSIGEWYWQQYNPRLPEPPVLIG